MTEDDQIQVVVNSHAAWGKATNEQDALCKMLENWRSDFQSTEVIHLVRYRGELEQLSMFGSVEVDGEIIDAVALEVDGDNLRELSDLPADADRLADRTLADATEVKQEEE